MQTNPAPVTGLANRACFFLGFVLAIFLPAHLLVAQVADQPVLRQFLDEEIDGVAWVDLESLSETGKESLDRMLISFGNPAANLDVARLREAGIRRAWLFVSLAELVTSPGAPCWVLESDDPDRAIELLPSLFSPGAAHRVEGKWLLCAGNPASLASLQTKQGEPREAIRLALARCQGKHGCVFAPAPSSLQIVVSMMGGPGEDDTISLLLEIIRQMDAAVYSSGEPDSPPDLRIVFRTPTAASQFGAIAGDLLRKSLRQAPSAPPHFAVADSEVSVVDPAGLLTQLLGVATASAMRSQAANNLKQLALACHNFESAHGVLPPQALVDNDGKKLLSWRVLLLPYLDQEELYSQFRLDEAWDSPHNIKLLERMPAVFGPSDAAQLAALREKGLTCSLAPLTPQSLFGKPGLGRDFDEILDGTSNTLLFVEVNPAHAVPWTKPEDVVLDGDNPLEKLRISDREDFLAARGDGSVDYLPLSMPVAVLQALLSIDGGETVDQSSYTLR